MPQFSIQDGPEPGAYNIAENLLKVDGRTLSLLCCVLLTKNFTETRCFISIQIH